MREKGSGFFFPFFAPARRRRFSERRKGHTDDAGRTSRMKSAWSPRRPPYIFRPGGAKEIFGAKKGPYRRCWPNEPHEIRVVAQATTLHFSPRRGEGDFWSVERTPRPWRGVKSGMCSTDPPRVPSDSSAPWGRMSRNTNSPRVARRRKRRRSTRGYNPPPRWGGSVNSRQFPLHSAAPLGRSRQFTTVSTLGRKTAPPLADLTGEGRYPYYSPRSVPMFSRDSEFRG